MSSEWMHVFSSGKETWVDGRKLQDNKIRLSKDFSLELEAGKKSDFRVRLLTEAPPESVKKKWAWDNV